MIKLPRNLIAEFIKSERSVRAYEEMQDAAADGQETSGALALAPTAASIAQMFEDRVTALEQAVLLAPSHVDAAMRDDLAPVGGLAELHDRLDRIEQAFAMLPQPQPTAIPAADGTYASPTSITLVGGIVTKIS